MIEMAKETYDNIFSLGYNCSVAYQLRENGLRNASGPFDWICTDELSIIANNLENKFSCFFLPGNMVMDSQQDENLDYYIYTDTATGIKSMHDVPKSCEDVAERLIELYVKFHRRVNRFYEAIQSGRRTLLIRRAAPSDDLSGLYKALKKVFPGKFAILYVVHVESSGISVEKVNDEVSVASMNCDSDNFLNVENFAGNFDNWNKLLTGFCQLASSASQFPPMHVDSVATVKRNIGSRKPLIWGLGEECAILEQCFKSLGLNDFVVFDPEKAYYDRLPAELIVEDASLIASDKHYVAVSYKKYREDVALELRGRGFRDLDDYIYFFKDGDVFN